MGPRVELKQEPVSPLIVIKNPWVILLTSGLFFDITTGLHLIVQLVQCLSDETVKAVGPFYLVSMPGEVQYPTQGVNV